MIKINGELIKIDRFPNGELNIDTQILNKISKNSTISVEFKWANNEDIFSLWFVLQHLQDNSFFVKFLILTAIVISQLLCYNNFVIMCN